MDEQKVDDMKKILALILTLALSMVLLASCEMLVPGPTERPSIGLPPETAAPGPAGTDDPAEENYGFTIFPEGNYLADPKFDTDVYLPDHDVPPAMSFMNYWGNMINELMCQSEDTWYYTQKSETGSMILMYADKATGIGGPLCGRPECLHNNSSCNAYLENASWPRGLCVYDGQLYWVAGAGSSKIYRMNLDGTGRSDGTALNPNDDTEVTNGGYARFHRGYVFSSGSKSTVVNGRATNFVAVTAGPMEGGDQFTIFKKEYAGYTPYCALRFIGNDVYISVFSYFHEDAENFTGYHSLFEVYRWNMKTRESEPVFIGSYEDGVEFERYDFRVVPGDGIYLQKKISDPEDGSYSYIAGKYSFATGEFEDIELRGYELRINGYPLDRWEPNYSEHYIIKWGNHEVYVWDYDGNPVYSVAGIETQMMSQIGADEDYLYLSNSDMRHYEYVAIPLDGGEIIVME